MTLELLADIEQKLHKELQRLKVSPEMNHTQLQYAFGTIEALSGNILFSLTAKRYGGNAAIPYHLPPGIARPGEDDCSAKIVS